MFGHRTHSALVDTVTAARTEALHRGDRRIGTEHLLLGLLHQSDSVATRSLGIDLAAANAALNALDRDALSAVGVEVNDLAPSPNPSWRTPPMTSAAAAVLARAVNEAKSRRVRDVRVEDLLRAIVARLQPDPAAELLDTLGVDRAGVVRRLDELAR